MDPETVVNKTKQEMEVIIKGLDGDDATAIIELCRSTIESNELNRAKKLKVFKEFFAPLTIDPAVQKNSTAYRQDIVNKYHRLYKTLPALQKLRDIDEARKTIVEELNFQVLTAEHFEKLEDEKKVKETRGIDTEKDEMNKE